MEEEGYVKDRNGLDRKEVNRRGGNRRFDVVEGVVIKGGKEVEVIKEILTAVGEWTVEERVTDKVVVASMIEQWRESEERLKRSSTTTRYNRGRKQTDVIGRVRRM